MDILLDENLFGMRISYYLTLLKEKISRSDTHVNDGLISYDEAGVNEEWTKVLDTRITGPEGKLQL